MEKETTACTGGGKCSLRINCIHYINHWLKNTKSYFIAEFDAEKGMCKNYKQLK